ncbi:MAG: 30S ribosomal protein S6 [Bryobacteraceae bacterium]|jgi:small subunit ribosomal protein S6|nr:30S ribosomal protein S6 [Bryobacteraceae bacterium]
MRVYEELFIVRPDATEEEIDAYVEQISSTITAAGGTVEKVDKWGVRRLAYRVEKRSEGFYVLIVFNAGADVAKEVERRMRMTDMVMKFITVRVDERMKKIEKRRKAREKRAKRRPAPSPVSAAPAMPASPAPGAPVAMPGVPGAPAPAPAEPEAAAPVAEVESES